MITRVVANPADEQEARRRLGAAYRRILRAALARSEPAPDKVKPPTAGCVSGQTQNT
jgi:hypothetical protein